MTFSIRSELPGNRISACSPVDGPRRVGFSHGGFYINDGVNQENATYAGWAADQFADLITAVNGGTATFSIAGDIDQADLPPFPDPDFGTAFRAGGRHDRVCLGLWTPPQPPRG